MSSQSASASCTSVMAFGSKSNGRTSPADGSVTLPRTLSLLCREDAAARGGAVSEAGEWKLGCLTRPLGTDGEVRQTRTSYVHPILVIAAYSPSCFL